MLISVIFLSITLIVYTILPELRTLDGKLLMGYCAALALSFILLATIQLHIVGDSEKLCTVVGFLAYLFVIMAFFWLNVISFDVWMTNTIGFASTSIEANSSRFTKYTVYVILCSLSLALISVFMELFATFEFLKPKFGSTTCFLDRKFCFNDFLLFFE